MERDSVKSLGCQVMQGAYSYGVKIWGFILKPLKRMYRGLCTFTEFCSVSTDITTSS